MSFAGGDQIRHQSLVTGQIFLSQHDRIANCSKTPQSYLNLAQFDAETADLYLMIDAPKILDVSIRQ